MNVSEPDDCTRAGTGKPTPGEILARQAGATGGTDCDARYAPDEQRNQGRAYAAVTAYLAGDRELVTDCVYELIRSRAEAAGAFVVLVMACGAMAELWGRAIGEEPSKAWQMYAAAVAAGVHGSDARAYGPGPDGRP